MIKIPFRPLLVYSLNGRSTNALKKVGVEKICVQYLLQSSLIFMFFYPTDQLQKKTIVEKSAIQGINRWWLYKKVIYFRC